MLGGNLGSLLYGDVSVMTIKRLSKTDRTGRMFGLTRVFNGHTAKLFLLRSNSFLATFICIRLFEIAIIMQTYSRDVDPVTSRFYIVTLWFTGVNIVFLFLL